MLDDNSWSMFPIQLIKQAFIFALTNCSQNSPLQTLISLGGLIDSYLQLWFVFYV